MTDDLLSSFGITRVANVTGLDRSAAMLEMPPQHNLTRSYLKLRRRDRDGRGVHEPAIAAQRAIGGGDYAILAVEGKLFPLARFRVQLDLVESRAEPGRLHLPQVFGGEV